MGSHFNLSHVATFLMSDVWLGHGMNRIEKSNKNY